MIVSDGDRVLQIVDNLLSNAFRATPDGGRIRLELGAGRTARSRSRSRTPGRGSRRSERERLFRPFVSGGGGTGLGLAIARELSAALGGRIDLDSEVGRGSRFELVLPARSGRPAGRRSAPASAGRSVDDARRAASSGALDPVEALVHRAPLAGDQVDEEREVVDARVPLGEQVGLEPLEPADHLVREALDLGEPARDRRRLLAQAVAERARRRRPGSTTWSSFAVCASASTWSRARSSAAAMSGGSE